MSLVEFKKRLCRPVEFKGQEPYSGAEIGQYGMPTVNSDCMSIEDLQISGGGGDPGGGQHWGSGPPFFLGGEDP